MRDWPVRSVALGHNNGSKLPFGSACAVVASMQIVSNCARQNVRALVKRIPVLVLLKMILVARGPRSERAASGATAVPFSQLLVRIRSKRQSGKSFAKDPDRVRRWRERSCKRQNDHRPSH